MTKKELNKIIGILQASHDAEREEMLQNCGDRSWEWLGFESPEAMLVCIDVEWDTENTIWEQGYLTWVRNCIDLIKSAYSIKQ